MTILTPCTIDVIFKKYLFTYMITPNESGAGSKSRAFNVAFTQLSKERATAIKAAEAAFRESAQKRAKRMELVMDYLKAGHRLTPRQLDFLEPEERAIVGALQVVNDPDLRKAAGEFKSAARNGLESFGNFVKGLASKI
jgi:hypothetical protein